MKYRRKPTLVEAVKWTGDNHKEVEEFTKISETPVAYDSERNEYVMEINHGLVKARKGDYIIKNINGQFYPCEADIFDSTYDKIEEVKIKKRRVIKG